MGCFDAVRLQQWFSVTDSSLTPSWCFLLSAGRWAWKRPRAKHAGFLFAWTLKIWLVNVPGRIWRDATFHFSAVAIIDTCQSPHLSRTDAWSLVLRSLTLILARIEALLPVISQSVTHVFSLIYALELICAGWRVPRTWTWRGGQTLLTSALHLLVDVAMKL